MTAPKCGRCGSTRAPILSAVAPCEYCGAAPRDTVETDVPDEVYAGRRRIVTVPRADATPPGRGRA
jgi:hypothetical protein